MRDTPWDDCKVAFEVPDSESVWEALGQGRDKHLLPQGWSMEESYDTATHCFVIFRVRGMPRPRDGRTVKRILDHIGLWQSE